MLELQLILKNANYRLILNPTVSGPKSIVLLLILTYYKGVEMMAIKSL